MIHSSLKASKENLQAVKKKKKVHRRKKKEWWGSSKPELKTQKWFILNGNLNEKFVVIKIYHANVRKFFYLDFAETRTEQFHSSFVLLGSHENVCYRQNCVARCALILFQWNINKEFYSFSFCIVNMSSQEFYKKKKLLMIHVL